MKPLGRNRWTFFYDRGPDCDSLTHTVLATYVTSYEQMDDNDMYPVEGITECGVLVTLYPGSKGRAREGVYINDDHMLTCIRCLSGHSTDGVSFRYEQKTLTFAARYGKTVSGRTPYPGPQIPLQNIPPPKMNGRRVVSIFDDYKNIVDYQAWLAGMLTTMPKP